MVTEEGILKYKKEFNRLNRLINRYLRNGRKAPDSIYTERKELRKLINKL